MPKVVLEMLSVISAGDKVTIGTLYSWVGLLWSGILNPLWSAQADSEDKPAAGTFMRQCLQRKFYCLSTVVRDCSCASCGI